MLEGAVPSDRRGRYGRVESIWHGRSSQTGGWGRIGSGTTHLEWVVQLGRKVGAGRVWYGSFEVDHPTSMESRAGSVGLGQVMNDSSGVTVHPGGPNPWGQASPERPQMVLGTLVQWRQKWLPLAVKRTSVAASQADSVVPSCR